MESMVPEDEDVDGAGWDEAEDSDVVGDLGAVEDLDVEVDLGAVEDLDVEVDSDVRLLFHHHCRRRVHHHSMGEVV